MTVSLFSFCSFLLLSKLSITVQIFICHTNKTLAEESLASSTPYKSKARATVNEEKENIVISNQKFDESELEEGELRDSRLTNASFHEYTVKTESWVEILEEDERREKMQVCVSIYVRMYVCVCIYAKVSKICFDNFFVCLHISDHHPSK